MIGSFELPVFFRYSGVPKLDPNVYLKVKAVNTSEFPLLAGPSNIFADEQLIGGFNELAALDRQDQLSSLK